MLREENAKLRDAATRSVVSSGSTGDNAVLLEALCVTVFAASWYHPVVDIYPWFGCRLAEVAQLRADNQRIMTLLAPLASIPKLLASLPSQASSSGPFSPYGAGAGAESGSFFSPSRVAGIGGLSGGAPEPAIPAEELGSLKLWVGSWNLGAKVCDCSPYRCNPAGVPTIPSCA